MKLTPYEEDLQRAHYFALGALTLFDIAEYKVQRVIADGFASFYMADPSVGLAPAWRQYLTDLVEWQMVTDMRCPHCGKPNGH